MSNDRTAEGTAPSSRAQLLIELRRLHRAAGAPTFRSMSRALSSVSHTTIAETLSGKRLPSWKILAESGCVPERR